MFTLLYLQSYYFNSLLTFFINDEKTSFIFVDLDFYISHNLYLSITLHHYSFYENNFNLHFLGFLERLPKNLNLIDFLYYCYFQLIYQDHFYSIFVFFLGRQVQPMNCSISVSRDAIVQRGNELLFQEKVILKYNITCEYFFDIEIKFIIYFVHF